MKFRFIKKAIHNLKCLHKYFNDKSTHECTEYIYLDEYSIIPSVRIPLSTLNVSNNIIEFNEEIKIKNNAWTDFAYTQIRYFHDCIYISTYQVNYHTNPRDITYVLYWKLPTVFDKPSDFKLYFDNKDVARKIAQTHVINVMIDLSTYKMQYKSILDKLLSVLYK